MNVKRQFAEVYNMIAKSRVLALQAINKELIELYWQVGSYIFQQVHEEKWGKGVVKNLANYLKKEEPDLKGFSAQNLWRMRQFFEVYETHSHLHSLLKEIPWSAHLHLLSKTESIEEKEFYLRMAVRERYSVRELERQINNALYERFKAGKYPKTPNKISEPPLNQHFKELYVLDFLELPSSHTEKDLQKAIVANLRAFIIELGSEFCFLGEEYRVQVGSTDFFIDLLFYHRELKCLVPIELKKAKFRPEFLGKMNFYLEALDRDVKKPHENPSVGIILCNDREERIVEYALSRNISPLMVAEYETKLIPKEKLKAKVEVFCAAIESSLDAAKEEQASGFRSTG